jgi:hypothetical protein
MQSELFTNAVPSRGAVLSSCDKYRYVLQRSWGNGGKSVLFIGLNPSTADHERDDATTRVCKNYAARWGFDSMAIANLFSFRSTDPKGLLKSLDPIGPENDKWLKRAIKGADVVICCWTSLGRHLNREAQVLKLIKRPYCLTMLRDGSPGHPLYKSRDLRPTPFLLRPRL